MKSKKNLVATKFLKETARFELVQKTNLKISNFAIKKIFSSLISIMDFILNCLEGELEIPSILKGASRRDVTQNHSVYSYTAILLD